MCCLEGRRTDRGGSMETANPCGAGNSEAGLHTKSASEPDNQLRVECTTLCLPRIHLIIARPKSRCTGTYDNSDLQPGVLYPLGRIVQEVRENLYLSIHQDSRGGLYARRILVGDTYSLNAEAVLSSTTFNLPSWL